MLSVEARQRLAVVLVGARNPQNIGAAARAMQDFGFSDLRVVNEFAPPFEAAQMEAKSAVRADEVMRSARLFSSLADATADCTLVAGTTAIGGRKMESTVLALRDAADVLTGALSAGGSAPAPAQEDKDGASADTEAAIGPKIALLFGSEKTGLTREQLSFCSLLLTIPMFAAPGRHLSMNLGQSVAVCLYELTRGGFEGSREIPITVAQPATVQDRERLVELLRQVMEQSGYSRRFPANARDVVIRQLAGNLASTRDEAAAWMGLFRLVLRSQEALADAENPAAQPTKG